MTETELKDFLDSFVDEPERNFVLVFSPRKTRRIIGTYKASLRRIKIYENSLPESIDLVSTGLHELGHHLAWERHWSDLMDIRHKTKRFPSHGRIFKAMLNGLLDTFNTNYWKRFQGVLVLDDRDARHAPRFVQSHDGITSAEDLISNDRAVNKLLDAIFSRRPNRVPTKNGPEVISSTANVSAELVTKGDCP